MFEDLIRELKELEEGTTFTIHVAPDEKGSIYKECPRGECHFVFKNTENEHDKLKTGCRIWV